jgi:hypothetical protein
MNTYSPSRRLSKSRLAPYPNFQKSRPQPSRAEAHFSWRIQAESEAPFFVDPSVESFSEITQLRVASDCCKKGKPLGDVSFSLTDLALDRFYKRGSRNAARTHHVAKHPVEAWALKKPVKPAERLGAKWVLSLCLLGCMAIVACCFLGTVLIAK